MLPDCRSSCNGRVEYLDADGNLIRHTDAATAREEYRTWCRDNGVEPLPALDG